MKKQLSFGAQWALKELKQLASSSTPQGTARYRAECRLFHKICEDWPIVLPEFNAWNDKRKERINDGKR